MSKKYLIGLLIILLLLIVATIRFWSPEDTWLCTNGVWVKHGSPSAPAPTTGCGPAAQACTMEAKLCPDGTSVGRTGPNCEFAVCLGELSPGSTYFGNAVEGDFNGDGLIDKAFLVTKQPGGSGTFYYLDVVLKGQIKDQTLESDVIGDRIAPQTTEFKDGLIIVNYADRRSNEPFSVKPSIGLSKYYKIIDDQLRGVVPPLTSATQTPKNWLTFTDAKTGSQFQYPPEPLAQYITPVAWPPQIQVTSGTFSCATQSGAPTKPDQTLKQIGGQNYCVEAMSEGAAGSTYTDYVYTTVQSNHLLRVIFTLRYPQCLNYDNPKQSDCLQERQTFDLDGLVDQMVQTIKL